MTTIRKVLLVAVLLFAATLTVSTPSWAAGGCGGSAFGGGGTAGGVAVGGRECNTPSPAGGVLPVVAGPATRVITCDLTAAPTADCQGAADFCLRPPLAPPTNVAVVQQQQPDGSWQQTAVNCDGNANEALAVTAAMVREEVVRLLPPVEVGVAPADGPTLVNLETVVWAPTAAQRQLGPVTILGQQVAITIRFDHAAYDFGDGTGTTTDAPGTPWSRSVCDTAQCPTLDGHTYTAVADQVTVTSTVSWTATFSVAGGPVQPIPGTIDGPVAQHPLQVLQGRSVLVR